MIFYNGFNLLVDIALITITAVFTYYYATRTTKEND